MVLLVSGVYFVCAAVSEELATSRLQARYFAGRAKDIAFAVQDGPSDRIRFPEDGPYDLRFGYSRLPEFTELLEARGYRRERQARWSDQMLELTDSGLFAPYHEKDPRAPRTCSIAMMRRSMPRARRPVPTAASTRFQACWWAPCSLSRTATCSIPNFPRATLRLTCSASRAPAMDQGVRFFNDKHDAAGGSTLATQIEKYRHSRAGRTSSPKEKLRQMASASGCAPIWTGRTPWPPGSASCSIT
ncbi:hypothetical protein ACU4GD_21485 [Cupriavidus basilensis]